MVCIVASRIFASRFGLSGDVVSRLTGTMLGLLLWVVLARPAEAVQPLKYDKYSFELMEGLHSVSSLSFNLTFPHLPTYFHFSHSRFAPMYSLWYRFEHISS